MMRPKTLRVILVFPSTILVAQTVKRLPSMWETQLIPGLGRSSGEGNVNPLQYSCLENPMDGGAWLSYSVWGRKESDMTERLHLTLPHLTLGPGTLQQKYRR